MTSIPRAASLALWLNAWLRGTASPDDVLAALGNDLHHVFVGLDPQRPLLVADLLAELRRVGGGAEVALTAPGDPVGLAGPAAFNATAMEAGEAILLPGARIGLVPVRVGGTIEWRGLAAQVPAPLDPREARHLLRSTLREVTEELVDLGIASWSSEIPDLLMSRTDSLPVPADLSDQDASALTSAALCVAIVQAAAEVEPGAISAWERARFDAGMRRLDSAARRVLVALCGAGSDSLTSP